MIKKRVIKIDVFQAIHTRRSIGRVKSDQVPREMIKKILEAATWAPNHYRTEPWRFFILTGEGRSKLSEVFVSIIKENLIDPQSEESVRKLKKEAEKPLRAPVLIVAAVEPSDKKRVIAKEEYAAVCAAIQNMLLTAHSLGLGAIWRTGEIGYEDAVKNFLGLTGQSEVVGFIYVGYPDMKELQGKRTDYTHFTKWITE